MKPSKACTKKARKSSRYYNEHRHIPAYSRPYSKPTVAERRTALEAFRNMFRRRESETKPGTMPE